MPFIAVKNVPAPPADTVLQLVNPPTTDTGDDLAVVVLSPNDPQ